MNLNDTLTCPSPLCLKLDHHDISVRLATTTTTPLFAPLPSTMAWVFKELSKIEWRFYSIPFSVRHS